MAPRKARPRQSRLSLQALTAQLKQQNEEFREALETIADVLEDVGILEVGEDEGEGELPEPEEEPTISEVIPDVLPPEKGED